MKRICVLAESNVKVILPYLYQKLYILPLTKKVVEVNKMNPVVLEYGDEFYTEKEVPEGLSEYCIREFWMDTAIDHARDNRHGISSVIDTLHTDNISVLLFNLEIM